MPHAVYKIYTASHTAAQVGEEGVAGRRFLASTTLRHYMYIYRYYNILYYCCARGRGVGKTTTVIAVYYTRRLDPLCERAAGEPRAAVGRSDDGTPGQLSPDDGDCIRPLRRLAIRLRRRHRHTCDTLPPRAGLPSLSPPKTRPGDLVTMAHHAGVDFTINYASPFSSPTHTHALNKSYSLALT